MPPPARKRPRSPFLKSIGDRIRQLRTEHGLSQEELAYRVGVDRTYQSDVERGQRNFSVSLLCDYGKVLNVRPEDLLR